MKSLGFILSYLATPQARRSYRILGWMLGLLVVIVAGYSAIFHELMDREGQHHSWPTAVYWTLVTMSTLGFGDITFQSDLGRTFSVIVLLSGSAFILVLLPFTFIQFVFLPWMESSQRARAPRQVPPEVRGHVVLTGTGPIESALILRLARAGIPYVSLVGDIDEAIKLHDEGFSVMVGDLDDPEAFRAAGVDRAALVAATRADTTNTNIAFTVREISESVAVVATADSEASVDILELAGCDQVLRLGEMLGTALARRVLVPDGRCQVIGEFGELLIAEVHRPRAARRHAAARLRPPAAHRSHRGPRVAARQARRGPSDDGARPVEHARVGGLAGAARHLRHAARCRTDGRGAGDHHRWRPCRPGGGAGSRGRRAGLPDRRAAAGPLSAIPPATWWATRGIWVLERAGIDVTLGDGHHA